MKQESQSAEIRATGRGPVKRLIVFDLDGTLAPSKSKLDPDVARLLSLLLGVMKVAVISGGAWPQFEAQLLTQLTGEESFENLFLLPTNGTQYFRYEGGWIRVYSEDLSSPERHLIVTSLTEAMSRSGLHVERVWGDVIEDRGSQITLSALGQDAPLAAKKRWDPDFVKRRQIVDLVEPMLPDFAIHMGGTTSIDVTRPRIDKAYGIGKLQEQLGISIPEMLFAGDAIFVGGNDFPVQSAGVDSILVSGPDETARIIQTIVACLGDGSVQMTSPERKV
jgi:hypothetical protein